MKKMVKCLKLLGKSKQACMSLVVFLIAKIICIYIHTKMLILISDCITHFNDPNIYIFRLVAFGLAHCAFTFIKDRFNKVYRNQLFTELNNLYTDKVLDAEYEMFVKHSCSKLITTVEATWHLVSGIEVILTMATSVIEMIAIIIAIYSINSTFVLPVVISYAICAPVIWYMFSKFEAISAKCRVLKLDRNKELDAVINGFAEVRSFGTQEYHKKSIRNKNNTLMHLTSTEGANLHGITNAVINIISYIPTTISIINIIKQITLGTINAAQGVNVVMYIWRLMDPIIMLIDGVDAFSEYTAHMDDFLEILNYKNSREDGTIKLEEFNNEITFDNISFSYDSSDLVLNDINLTIKKGSKIGICGVSGGGKSTLLKLIPRFYDTYNGSIKIDGIDTRELTANSLRSKISIVHQDNYILDGTIYDNIVYGNWKVTEYDVIEACKKASIYDFIKSLPDGFNTNVGPRGLKLSGGQKQRIALARVFLGDTDIILLDEATSALDNESENIIQESMNLLKDKTLIIVAHRLSTIKDCDKIIVIDNHSIAESGSHEELITNGGIYHDLYIA